MYSAQPFGNTPDDGSPVTAVDWNLPTPNGDGTFNDGDITCGGFVCNCIDTKTDEIIRKPPGCGEPTFEPVSCMDSFTMNWDVPNANYALTQANLQNGNVTMDQICAAKTPDCNTLCTNNWGGPFCGQEIEGQCPGGGSSSGGQVIVATDPDGGSDAGDEGGDDGGGSSSGD
jgi:hypothetical protein